MPLIHCLPLFMFLLLTNECGSDGLVQRFDCSMIPANIPDTDKRTADFIRSFGFGAEIHEVVTADGYFITLHRIVSCRPTPMLAAIKPSVIIQHGISASSVVWFLNGEKSLPILLANEGFDVWLEDTRGNSYSNKHVYLQMSDPQYWSFSFHEQGTMDLASSIDYITSLTGNRKLFYIGHSRGTTMALALLSTRPEYNDKIQLASLLAPVAYIRNARHPIFRVIFDNPVGEGIQRKVKLLGIYMLPGTSKAAIQFRRELCDKLPMVCIDLLFSFSGYDYELLNQSLIPVYMAHYPEGGAIKEYEHYHQIGISDEFRQFDYGQKRNWEIYKSPTPPLYDLSQITTPISLHYGDNDGLVQPQDLNRLEMELNSVVASVRIPFPKFTHNDFLWATRADELLYRPLIQLMKERLSS